MKGIRQNVQNRQNPNLETGNGGREARKSLASSLPDKRSNSCLAKGFDVIRSPRRPLRNPQIYESGKQEGRKTEGGPKDTQIKRNVFRSPSPQIARISIYLVFESGKNGLLGCLKLVRLPPSFAATLTALPSISEIPFLDSCVPAFLIKCSEIPR